jgi:hypothetical protein
VEPYRSPVEQDELQELQLESSSPARLKPPNTWPKTRTRSHSEASITNVSDFAETRENILRIVRGKPLFTPTAGDTSNEVLSELRKMRGLLEKSDKK